VVVAALIAVFASSKPSAQLNASSPLLGKPAPAISGKSLSGAGAFTLAQYAGKWVLVNFSASWCVPCQEETPQLKQFESEHTAPGVPAPATILAVAFDEGDKANLAAYLKSNRASWPAIDDGQAEIAYGVTGIPESYLVDPRGTVVAKYVGGITAREVDTFISRASSGS
jgi:cytochrome c biogenesis protein CcmG/thiol:disulfide interchange protein DsbE